MLTRKLSEVPEYEVVDGLMAICELNGEVVRVPYASVIRAMEEATMQDTIEELSSI